MSSLKLVHWISSQFIKQIMKERKRKKKQQKVNLKIRCRSRLHQADHLPYPLFVYIVSIRPINSMPSSKQPTEFDSDSVGSRKSFLQFFGVVVNLLLCNYRKLLIFSNTPQNFETSRKSDIYTAPSLSASSHCFSGTFETSETSKGVFENV